MSIRLRDIPGHGFVAFCAVETDPMPGDIYLDDGAHMALAEKFSRDWRSNGLMPGEVPPLPPAIAAHRVRDAEEEHAKWEAAGRPAWTPPVAPLGTCVQVGEPKSDSLFTKRELAELTKVREVLGRLMLDVGRGGWVPSDARARAYVVGASAARLGNAWDLVGRVLQDAEQRA